MNPFVLCCIQILIVYSLLRSRLFDLRGSLKMILIRIHSTCSNFTAKVKYEPIIVTFIFSWHVSLLVSLPFTVDLPLFKELLYILLWRQQVQQPLC